MRLPMSKFKKVSGDVHHSVMRDDRGHELKIMHKALSPKMRAEMIAMPQMTSKTTAAEGASAPKVEAPKHAPAKAAMDKPAYFGGGRVREAPVEADPSKTEGNQEARNAIAKSFGGQEPKKPVAQNMAQGGEVEESAACGVQRSFGNPCTPETEKPVRADNQEARNAYAKRNNSFAEGGEVAPPIAPAAPQAPVVINIGTPGMMGPTGNSSGVPVQAEQQAIQAPPQGAPGMMETTGPTGQPMPPAPGMTGVTEPSGQPPLAMATSGPTAPAHPQQDMPIPQGPGASPEGLAQAEAAAPPAPGVQAPAGDPYGTEAYYNSLQSGISNQKAGLQQQGQAAAAEGAMEAKTLEDAAAKQQKLQDGFQANYQALETERKALADDISNKHIDPNHFWNSKSTGGKIATLVGMFIGGLGQNDVPAMIEQHINRDIDAQKAELGKKENLLSANMKQFGNMKDATAMTSVMMNESIKSQLQRAAALAKGPMEKAKALQGIGLIDANNAQALGQIAMRRTLMQGMKGGHVAPEQVIRMVVPEGEKANAFKELKEAQEMISTRDRVMAAYDEIAKLSTLGSRLMDPIQAGRRIAALKAATIPGLSKQTAGRYTEQDAETIEKIFSGMGNSQETIDANRLALYKLAAEKMHFPILNAYGIDMANQGRYTGAQGRSRIPESAPVFNKR